MLLTPKLRTAFAVVLAVVVTAGTMEVVSAFNLRGGAFGGGADDRLDAEKDDDNKPYKSGKNQRADDETTPSSSFQRLLQFKVFMKPNGQKFTPRGPANQHNHLLVRAGNSPNQVRPRSNAILHIAPPALPATTTRGPPGQPNKPEPPAVVAQQEEQEDGLLTKEDMEFVDNLLAIQGELDAEQMEQLGVWDKAEMDNDLAMLEKYISGGGEVPGDEEEANAGVKVEEEEAEEGIFDVIEGEQGIDPEMLALLGNRRGRRAKAAAKVAGEQAATAHVIAEDIPG